MLPSISAATERLIAYQDKVEAIARNVSNTGTFGYRAIDSRFKATLHRALSPGTPAEQLPAGTPVANQTGASAGGGVEALAGALLWPRLQTEGTLVETGLKTDVALRGDGFFVLRGPGEQTYYTRDGRFSVDGDGRLVTSSGSLVDVEWTGGTPQSLAGKSLVIDRRGLLYLDEQGASGGKAADPVARLKLATFDRPADLRSDAGIDFTETAASGPARLVQADGDKLQVIQGSLEAANVDMISEMTDLLSAQRSYEMVLRALQQTDAMLGMANNIRR